MDNMNWRPTEYASGTVGDSCMESGDWKAQLHPDSRQRIVNKLMETLKRHLPYSGNEGLEELKKRAVRDEEEIYTAATSQSDYLRKISLKMLAVEIGSENPMADSMQSNSAANSVNPSSSEYKVTQQLRNLGQLLPINVPSNHTLWGQQPLMSQRMHNNIASFDSTAQTGDLNGGDWQEDVYQKIKAMKDLYLLDLNDMHQEILGKLQQLNVFKNMLERFMQFLQIPKHGILSNYKDKLGTYEKQIANVINSNRRKAAASQQQSQALPPTHMHSLQQSQQSNSHLTQAQSHENQMNLHDSVEAMHSNNMGSLHQNSVSSLPGSSNSQLNMVHSMQLNSNIDPVQNSSMNSLPQVSGGCLLQRNAGGSVASVDFMESGDWRAQLDADARQRIVNKIMETLKRHLPFAGDDGLQELKKIAVKFEEKIYTIATSQSDYLRKISLKMLTMEARSQHPMPDAMQSNSAANIGNPSDPV